MSENPKKKRELRGGCKARELRGGCKAVLALADNTNAVSWMREQVCRGDLPLLSLAVAGGGEYISQNSEA